MLTVEAARTELHRLCARYWLDWALGKRQWPIRIALQAPDAAAFDKDVIATQVWAGSWQAECRAGKLPGSVRTKPRRAHKLGSYDLPTAWVIDSAEEALSVVPEIADKYSRARQRFEQAIQLPDVAWGQIDQIPTKSARTIAEFDELDWSKAVAVISYLAAGPGEAMMIRQLAVPGVHSKWIEHNAALLAAMLGVPADTKLGGPLERLMNHIGLKAEESPIHVKLACPQLRAAAGGLADFAAPISALNASTLKPELVLIIENLKFGSSIIEDLDGAAIIYGLGAAATIVCELSWATTAPAVIYWGDIDRAGLAILAGLRRSGVEATSVLMDSETLDRYKTAWHDTAAQIHSDNEIPIGLTSTEGALYNRLNEYHRSTGRELQLEQEHIPRHAVIEALAALRNGQAT
ncbi:MAG: hypothetical protein K0U84_20035 [Actinomycetia bacterium]|nr:hypothetical protein [Actinomycetes bacterium]